MALERLLLPFLLYASGTGLARVMGTGGGMFKAWEPFDVLALVALCGCAAPLIGLGFALVIMAFTCPSCL